MAGLRQRYYDLFSRVYDRFIALHAAGQGGALKRELAQKAGLRPGDTVLDICTGTGTLLGYLQAELGEKGQVIGLDFSGGMLEQARAKTAHLQNVWLVQADVRRLPIKSDRLDGVTCAHAFYELKGESQHDCLSEIRRCLKPETPFLMMEHEVPDHPVVRFLFHLRVFSMGASKALEILRHEKERLGRYFADVKKTRPPGGRSKILICRR